MIPLFRMTEEEFNHQLERIKERNLQKERIRALKAEAKKGSKNFKLPSTSKMILLVVFLMCIEVLVYCEYAMIALGNAEAMYALIGIPASLVPVCLGYFNKSKEENTVNGIVYETTMEKLRQGKSENEESVG